jgi:serine/threonine protein kinase
MSPEQVKGHEGNFASDIYSFGIVLYELLTGVTPFDSESEFEVMQAHTNRKPIPPASINPMIPAALNNAILKALEKEPSKRFGSAGEFRLCLQQMEEVDTSQPPFWERFAPKWRWAKFPIDLKGRLPWRAGWHTPWMEKLHLPYVAGGAFLAASLLVAVIVIFSSSNTKTKSSDREDFEQEKKPMIEVAPDTDMGRVMQGQRYREPVGATQRTATAPPTDQRSESERRSSSSTATTTPATQERVAPPRETQSGTQSTTPSATPSGTPNTAPSTSRSTTSGTPQSTTTGTTQSTTPSTTPSATQRATQRAASEEQAKTVSTKEQEAAPAIKATLEAEQSASLGKQVVIARGTRIDAVMDNSYEFSSVADGARVTLTVEGALERSGVVVVGAGAKVHALLRKNTRRQELELEVVEVESVTGKRLKAMGGTLRAGAFRKGERVRVLLDYNRLN